MINRFLLLLVLFPALLKAQSRMVPLPPSGPTLDSIRNKSRFVIEKLASTSAWMVHEYDAQDSLMTIGTFEDEKLTIPSGRFKYYQYNPPYLQITYDYSTHKTDSVIVPAKNFLYKVGYFVNGEKTGIWATFNASNEKIITETLEHGKLNGLYEGYNGGKVSVSGNYVNDMREGEWHMLSAKGDTMQTDIYKQGKLIKAIPSVNAKKDKYKHVTDPHPKYDFIRYLNTQLSKKGISQSGTKRTFYSFAIDTTGRIIEPSVIRNIPSQDIDFEVDKVVIDAMLNAPMWIPGERDKQKIMVSISIQLAIQFNQKRISVSQISPSDN